MKKKTPATIASVSAAEAEKKKRAKMRQAVTIANGGNKLGGVEKTHRHKPPPVTLPSPRSLRKLIEGN